MNRDITANELEEMDYVSFMGFLNETNRPPGGKESLRLMAQNAFLNHTSYVLHSGCNTGYCSFELSHLTKCRVQAIDINDSMLESAKARLSIEPEPYRNLINFKKGDAHSLEFEDNTFDLVMSGGSTAFMSDKSKVVQEYVRVCKSYGFVGDVFLYYHQKPPQDLVNKINTKLQINIQNWDLDYWTSLYTNEGLELYYLHQAKMPVQPTDSDVLNYCKTMVAHLSLKGEVEALCTEKLYGYMSLFNQNNEFLSYGVLLCRKMLHQEQISLFGN